jgi:hypothetical protein
MEVVRAQNAFKPSGFGVYNMLQQRAGRVLLVGSVVTNDQVRAWAEFQSVNMATTPVKAAKPQNKYGAFFDAFERLRPEHARYEGKRGRFIGDSPAKMHRL